VGGRGEGTEERCLRDLSERGRERERERKRILSFHFMRVRKSRINTNTNNHTRTITTITIHTRTYTHICMPLQRFHAFMYMKQKHTKNAKNKIKYFV